MFVRFSVSISTIYGGFLGGHVYELDADQAEENIRAGIAVEVSPDDATAKAIADAKRIQDNEPPAPQSPVTDPPEAPPAPDQEQLFAGFPLNHFDDMTDQQILDVDGVGPALLKKIRAAQK